LLAPADIKEPLQSKELQALALLPVRPVYEYDIDTQAGETYTFTCSEEQRSAITQSWLDPLRYSAVLKVSIQRCTPFITKRVWRLV
jgi:hypothetical protein